MCNVKEKVSALIEDGKWFVSDSLLRSAPDIANLIYEADNWW